MKRTFLQCHNCRHAILDTFASLAGISLPSQTHLTSPARRTIHNVTQQSRSFSALRSLLSNPETPRWADNGAKDTDSSLLSQTEASHSNSSSTNPIVPWYLQIKTPPPPSSQPLSSQDLQSPLSHLQDIPALPSNPPPILHPILNHLSTQIGLDSLVLLDLRDLDPPAALGSNLLMIVGTARSIKHLNVSADRFCRWLRSTYKLHPYADGLLGRNELKLKLRRRARKMKLAQSVGNTVAMQQDDGGITTGWICVNVGTVDIDAHIDTVSMPNTDVVNEQLSNTDFSDVHTTKRKQEELQEDEEDEYKSPAYPPSVSSTVSAPASFGDGSSDYIGFGSASSAPRIVVQMFTEDKRAEMDLEGLWDFRSARRQRKKDRLDQRIGEVGLNVLDDDGLEREMDNNDGSRISRSKQSIS